MKKRKKSELAIYTIEKDVKTLSLESLKKLFLCKTSEVVYITKEDKLYGMVCLGDILRHKYEKVVVNKQYCSVIGYDIVKVREIFREKCNINKIPIVNEQGELLADYSRWEDGLFFKRNCKWFAEREIIGQILKPYKRIYIIEPCNNADQKYLYLQQCLRRSGIEYVEIKKDEIEYIQSENDVLIFCDEDERRGVQCLLQVRLEVDEKAGNLNQKWITYRGLLTQILEKYNRNIIMKMGGFTALPAGKVDEKASLLFAQLKKKGVQCLSIYANDAQTSEYIESFQQILRERVENFPYLRETPWAGREMADTFWTELYQLEDYKNGIVQRELGEGWCKGRYQDMNGKYCKMRNGRRITCYQPEEYIGTIYFLGPCIIFGAFTEDKYTIESYLQKKLLETGFFYRVENLASPLRWDSELEGRLTEIGEYTTNDIVVYLSQAGEVAGIQNCSLWDMYENNHVSPDWVTNYYVHCNSKVNQILANDIFELLKSSLSGNMRRNTIYFNFQNTMKEYIYYKYLNKYFEFFEYEKYNTIGAIVMNCNPFSKGHRYLIEQAQRRVEFLIVFVVEEDASIFSFEERYWLVCEGVKDLDNILVVPSGEFILSRNNFEEYFTKVETELIRMNAEYDIRMFADYIAKPLHITHRFAGEELTDRVTHIYNEEMKRILPSKGISFVEIPRKRIRGEAVSASKVREYLKCGEYDKAVELLPKTTRSILFG